MSKKGLTDKQERFCDEYLIDLNATQAAIRAGYSEKTAHSIGNENLIKPEIQERIREKQKEIQERNKITADMVVQELANVGFMNIGEVFNENGLIQNPSMLSQKAKAAISSVKITKRSYGRDDNKTEEETTEYKLWDKVKALTKLGEHLGIFENDNEENKNTNPLNRIADVLENDIKYYKQTDILPKENSST
jgi:phage terminase small subunit